MQTNKSRFVAVILIFGLIFLAGCASMEHRSEELVKKNLPSFEPQAHIKVHWKKDVGGGAGLRGDRLQLGYSPENDCFVTVDYRGRVIATQRKTRHRLWKTRLKEQVSSGTYVAGDKVYVGTRQGKLIALNVSDGSIAWSDSLESELLATPMVSENGLFVSTTGANVHKYDPQTGEAIWHYQSGTPPLLMRRAASPLFWEDKVMIGFASGRVVALNQADGYSAWERAVSLPKGNSDLARMVDMSGDMLIANDLLFAGTYQGKLVGLEPLTGDLIWEHPMSSITGMVSDGQALYLADVEGNIYSVNQEDGSILWKQDALYGRVFSKPIVYKEWLLLGDDDGYIHLLSRETGGFLARHKLSSAKFEASPLLLDNRLYLLDQKGKLYSIEVN